MDQQAQATENKVKRKNKFTKENGYAILFFDMEKTIAAISTPFGTGGVAIIRMSGKDSLRIAKTVFSSTNLDWDKIEPRKLFLGKFNGQSFSDECLMVYFKTPFSYTGEDIVEFQVHGGQLVAEKVLSTLLENGAKLSENGEFTKRAFINGKISLEKAEGVIDTINAESEAELKASSYLISGELHKKIKEMQDKIKTCLAKLEVSLDYPENDYEQTTLNETKIELAAVKKEINKILENSKNAGVIKAGLNVAIVGKPNVGKSSLLNAIVGDERAIVTPVAGTTRDTISETIVSEGLKINFIDTAGLRKTENEIESIGIERAKKEIEKADLVLFLIDSSESLTDEEEKEIRNLKNQNYLLVANKTDIKSKKIENKLKILEKNNEIINISAKNKFNIDYLIKKIKEKTINNNINFSSIVLTNVRQIEAMENAKKKIDEAIIISKSMTTDIVSQVLKEAWVELGKITGETENEAIIDLVFSKFCLGK